MLRKIIDIITLAILMFIFAIIFAIIFMSNLSTIKSIVLIVKTIVLIVWVGGLCILTIMTYIDKIKRWRKWFGVISSIFDFIIITNITYWTILIITYYLPKILRLKDDGKIKWNRNSFWRNL